MLTFPVSLTILSLFSHTLIHTLSSPSLSHKHGRTKLASQLESQASQLQALVDSEGHLQLRRPARSAAWAGMSFWRYHAPARSASTQQEGAKDQSKPKGRGRWVKGLILLQIFWW
jgi:hypothetical protein